MRKVYPLLLAAFLLMAALLSACNGGETKAPEVPSQNGTETAPGTGSENESESETVPVSSGVFQVGYARENITPDATEGLPLAGYGNTDKRLSTGFLDYIYMTCIAFQDEEGNRLVWFTQDLIASNGTVVAKMKEMVSEATRIDIDHILVTATHTHSNVDQGQTKFNSVNKYISFIQEAGVKAALAALDDLHPASFNWSTADLTGYNFVRHYFTDVEGDPSVGDNHGALAEGKVVRHTTEANHIMYILEIDREDAKDILLTTWRAHPTITGGLTKGEISADFVGYIRNEIEKKTEYLFAYYQGDAGNMNPRTRLSADVEFNPPKDVKEYGKQVSELILKGLEENGLTPIKTGTISTINTTFTGEINHDWDSLAGIGQELREYWNQTSDYQHVYKEGVKYKIIDSLGHEQYIQSPYHAGAIASRAGMGKTSDVEIHATRIGDFAFINAPFELFDTNGDFVRENSPSPYTMVIGYSNNGNGYLPSQFAYEYDCYESNTTRFKPGTGELLASKFVELLKELYQ